MVGHRRLYGKISDILKNRVRVPAPAHQSALQEINDLLAAIEHERAEIKRAVQKDLEKKEFNARVKALMNKADEQVRKRSGGKGLIFAELDKWLSDVLK